MHLELSPKNQAAYDRALSNGMTPEEIQELIFNILDSAISPEMDDWINENKTGIKARMTISLAEAERGQFVEPEELTRRLDAVIKDAAKSISA